MREIEKALLALNRQPRETKPAITKLLEGLEVIFPGWQEFFTQRERNPDA